MKYYVFAGRKEINFNNVEKYMVKIDEGKKFAMFEINDNNYNDFLYAIDFVNTFSKIGYDCMYAFGENKELYSIKPNAIVKTSENDGISLKSNWKRLCKLSKQIDNETRYRNEIISKADSNFIFKRKSLIGFNQYLFIDKGNDTVIPFRFRKSKKDGQPLIVYFSGGGTLGYDNNKTLQEFLFFANGKKVIKKDYNILIPQQMHSEEGSEDKIFNIYTKNCAVIINELANKHNVDKNRIYTFGTSAGAKCVWKTLINNPDMFAGAVEAMGMIYNYENVEFEKISHIPIWLAHSCDDTAVKIDSDDYCYEKLKSLGADIKYTRWEKYGHKMSEKFYKSEPWFEWLSTKTK